MTSRGRPALAWALAVIAAGAADGAGAQEVPHTFSPGDRIRAEQVNENFGALGAALEAQAQHEHDAQYLRNQAAPPQDAAFNISGSGMIGGGLGVGAGIEVGSRIEKAGGGYYLSSDTLDVQAGTSAEFGMPAYFIGHVYVQGHVNQEQAVFLVMVDQQCGGVVTRLAQNLLGNLNLVRAPESGNCVMQFTGVTSEPRLTYTLIGQAASAP